MELIDFIIGLLLLLEIINGYRCGFLAEIGSIIGLISGFLIASSFLIPMTHFFSEINPKAGPWCSVVAFLFTFLLVYLVITILAKIFEGFLGFIALGWLNRLAGGLFCMLKGVFVLSIFLNLCGVVDKGHHFIGVKHIESSVFYEPVLNFAPLFFPSFKSINEPWQE